MSSTAPSTNLEPPASGRAGPLRIRSVHPSLAERIGEDDLTLRLTMLIASHPGIGNCRGEDIAKLSDVEKAKLLAQLEHDLGLDGPQSDVLPFTD